MSFSRSLSPNSDNTHPATESVIYSQDSQGVSLATGDFTLSNDSSQPDWRTNYRGDYKDTNLKPICTQDLISWGFQVARGMEYLSERKVNVRHTRHVHVLPMFHSCFLIHCLFALYLLYCDITFLFFQIYQWMLNY